MIRLFKSKIYVSPFALLLIAVISLSVDAVYLYIALFCALLHELSHIAFMKIFDVRIIKISVYPFGADIKADTSSLSYKKEAAVFLSGPAASFFAFVISFVLYGFYGEITMFAFSISNFVFFFVNILPVRGLDGGRALWSFLCEKYEFVYVQRLFDIVTTVFFGVLCTFALLLLFFTGYNLSLAFICGYLFISEYARQKLCGGYCVIRGI